MSADVGVVLPRTEPALHLDSAGRILRANQAALDLIGLDLNELRALPPGALAAEPADPDEQAALREQWEAAGRAAMVGLTTIKRGDGQNLRVAFAIDAQVDGTLVATLTPTTGSTTAESEVYTIGDVLTRWRAVERTLEALEPGTAEYEATSAEVGELRAQHNRLFEARTKDS